MDKRFTIAIILFILLIGLLAIFFNSINNLNDKKKLACEEELSKTIDYAKNNNLEFNSCMNRNRALEIGVLGTTDKEWGLFCAKEIKDFELLRLLENVRC